MKDVMLFSQFNVPAIALASESEVPDIELVNRLKERFENIVVFYDNDKQGILSMQKAKQHLPCMWLPRLQVNKTKDISDYYKENGLSETSNLIDYAKNKLSLWNQER
jgi:DNA primase